MYSTVKCLATQVSRYGLAVGKRAANDTRATVAANLRALLTLRDWSEHDLARKSGVSQKAINNILHRRTAASIETTEALAAAFGLKGWHLLIPRLTVELLTSSSLSNLVDDWISATPEGRDIIQRIASREGHSR